MVRLLIPLIAGFLIWLLFFSAFSKRMRILLSLGVLLLSALLFWLDMDSRTIRTGVVDTSQLINCGVKSEFSYRSNYNFDICLRNDSTDATVKKIDVRFDAAACDLGKCVDVQSRTETIYLDIAPEQQRIHRENIEFDLVPKDSSNIVWTAEITDVWALK